jgi:hypothetical protein
MPGGKMDLDSGRVMMVTSKQALRVRAAVIGAPKLPEALCTKKVIVSRHHAVRRRSNSLTPNIATLRMGVVVLVELIVGRVLKMGMNKDS